MVKLPYPILKDLYTYQVYRIKQKVFCQKIEAIRLF